MPYIIGVYVYVFTSRVFVCQHTCEPAELLAPPSPQRPRGLTAGGSGAFRGSRRLDCLSHPVATPFLAAVVIMGTKAAGDGFASTAAEPANRADGETDLALAVIQVSFTTDAVI